MTDPLNVQPIARRYRLATFGPPALFGADADTLLGQHGHHRRRLALLAVLAAAGERGRSRDQLLLLFWPEATQQRARHSLDQLLYALRSSLGDTVFDGVNPVRLNPDVVANDVGAFNAALERGDLEAAVNEYRGAFLDGFYIDDAPEFERWAEAERARLAANYAAALERLARDASAAGNYATAVDRWKLLVDADPMSSRNATGLIEALMNAGDHSSALQYAKQYESLVTKELGVGAGPAVATLVDEVRAKAGTEPLPSLPSARSTTQQAPLAASSPAPVEPPPPLTSARRRSLPLLIVTVVALVVLAVAISLRPKSRNTSVTPSTEASIAVLPFANISGAPEDGAVVDGLTEEMIGVLAKLGHVRVIGRTSVFTFKNTKLGARQIADSLGVVYLLEGGVRRFGSHLRVEVRLIDARDGSTRWSDTYNRDLGDILAVQSDIASAVARALDLQFGATTLAAIQRGSTTNIAAHEMYLRGNDAALMRSDSTARVALDYFKRAAALDPKYAAAYAGISRAQVRAGLVGGEKRPRRDLLALAEQAALKAVELGDSVGDAHAALGQVRKSNYDMSGAETELRRAAELEPTTARFREYLVQLYVPMERPKDALDEAQRALELDPLSPTATAEFARALIANDRCDEALVQLDKLKSLQLPVLRASALASQCYARKKMWPQAIAEMQRIAPTAGPQAVAVLGYLFARSGRPNEARQVLAAMLDRERRFKTGAFQVATVYAGLGDNDEAFAWLDKSFDDRSLNFENMIPLEGLRPDPRFGRFRQRLNGQKR